MSGLAGCLLHDDRRPADVLARMLLAPAARGRATRWARAADVCVFGETDTDLTEDLERREALALSGYVRLDGRPSDAAALLTAWRDRGERLLDALGGEFSMAIFAGGRLLVTRDALGTRPMYVAALPRGGVAFSASLFALLHAGPCGGTNRHRPLRSLPEWIVNRPKRGMTLPLAAWFEATPGDLARDVLTEHAIRERGLFRWEYVATLLDRRPMRRDHARARTIDKLWLVLITELHHQTIDRIGREARAHGTKCCERGAAGAHA